MSILGLSKQEIEARFDEVVEFAEIGEAIDSPVQSYSSGMAARLGFACAIHTEPDILLIDEVLAVGDIKFRSKCYRMLSLLRQQGVAFVMVSHDANSIMATCNDAILLSKGEILESGNVAHVMQRYNDMLFSVKDKTIKNSLFLPKKDKSDSTGVDITYLCFKDINSNILEYPISGTPTVFCIGINSHKETNIHLTITVDDKFRNNERLLNISTFSDKQCFRIFKGEHEIKLEMPYLCLTQGDFRMKLSISQDKLYIYDAVEVFEFNVKNTHTDIIDCVFYQPRNWHLLSL
jgi:lipopolysaccharide transport system ATP-binding protein